MYRLSITESNNKVLLSKTGDQRHTYIAQHRQLNRRAEITFDFILYHVPCQCRALAWPFIVIKESVFS